MGCTIFIFGSLVEFAFVNSIWRRKRNVDVKKVNSKHILKSTLSPKLTRRQPAGRSRSFCVGGTAGTLGSETDDPYNNYMTVHHFPIFTIKEGIPMNKMDLKNFPKGPPSSRRQSTAELPAVSGVAAANITNNNVMMSDTRTGKTNHMATPMPTIKLNKFHVTLSKEQSKLAEATADSNKLKQDIVFVENQNDDDIYEDSHNGWTTLTPQQISMWIDRKARVIFPVAFLIFNAFFWVFVYVL